MDYEKGLRRLREALADIGSLSEPKKPSLTMPLAERAVASTARKNPACLDTLAAAYAEVGQFEKAVSTQQEAMALLQTEAENDAEKDDYQSRLKLYEAETPYRARD